jgi:hypothetical protein
MPRRLLVLLILVLAAAAGAAVGCRSEPAAVGPPSGEWVEVSAAPLSPRLRVTVAWTGSEILVIGGDQFACPPHLDCAIPDDPALSDGAAYDPTSNRWRRIADAPIPVRRALPVTLGGDVFLLTWSDFGLQGPRLLQYETARDAWTIHALPSPANVYQIGATDSAIVLYQSTHELGQGSDYLFDPVAGTWAEFVPSPLGAGFDRQLVWGGEALYLFDRELVPSPGGARGPSLVRAARWDIRGSWGELPTGETLGHGTWLVDGERLVLPSLGCADGGATNNYGRCIPFGAVFDTTTDQWSELPNAPQRGEKGAMSSGAIGAKRVVIMAPGYPMFDASTDSWFEMPALEADGFREVAAAGRYGFTFGGVEFDSSNGRGELLDDGWIWRAPGGE